MRRVTVGVVAAVSLLIEAVMICAQPALAVSSAPAKATATCSPSLAGVSLSPASVPGGAPSTVTATLTCSPSKAETITFKGFSGTRVPATLHVAAGKNAAWGAITTSTRKSAEHGWITATFGKTSRRAELTVTATPKTCSSPALAATPLPGLAYVGDHVVLGLKLTCTPAKAVKLSLKATGSPAAAPALPVPATVTIGAYYQSVNVTLTPKAYEEGQYKSTISIHYGAKTFIRSITIDPGLSGFVNSPDSCSPNSVDLSIFFTGAVPSSGLTVKLKSSDTAAISVPATVPFTQPGSLGGGFTGVTVNSVSKNTNVTLTATMGSKSITLTITLLAVWQSGDKITLVPSPGPGPFYGPSNYEYLVYLSNPAPASGLSGTATTDDPTDVQDLDGQVFVTPGCTTTEISFEVPYELAPVHTTVTVSIGGSTASVPVTIEPSLESVTLPDTIVGGQTGTGTVTLTGAPDVAETVYLNSTDGVLTIPDGVVTIPAGQSSATFTFDTYAVTSDVTLNVYADHIVSDQLADSVASNTIDVTP
jgi:hypothetical protein